MEKIFKFDADEYEKEVWKNWVIRLVKQLKELGYEIDNDGNIIKNDTDNPKLYELLNKCWTIMKVKYELKRCKNNQLQNERK